MINFQTHQRINYAVFAFILLLLLPFPTYARIDVSLEWSPNPESDRAVYKVFSRVEGEDYDYSEPDWQGTDTSCTITILDGDVPCYFVARAFNELGFESDNSNEVCYRDPEDGNYLYSPGSEFASEGGGDSGCFLRAIFQ